MRSFRWTDRGIAKNPARLPFDFAIPYVVVEVAAITNWVDEGRFRSPTFKERAAEALVTGLKRYFLLGVECGNKHGKTWIDQDCSGEGCDVSNKDTLDRRERGSG